MTPPAILLSRWRDERGTLRGSRTAACFSSYICLQVVAFPAYTHQEGLSLVPAIRADHSGRARTWLKMISFGLGLIRPHGCCRLARGVTTATVTATASGTCWNKDMTRAASVSVPAVITLFAIAFGLPLSRCRSAPGGNLTQPICRSLRHIRVELAPREIGAAPDSLLRPVAGGWRGPSARPGQCW